MSNEIAARLIGADHVLTKAEMRELLDEVRAAERRATVERIRERLDRLDYRGPRVFDWDSVAAILDAEAAR